MEECFSVVYAFPGMTWEDAKGLAIPVRKWLIERWNKQKKLESGGKNPSTERPLTEAERMKMIAKAQQSPPTRKPIDPSSFMGARKNIPKK